MDEEKKTRILYLIYALNAGGIESFCINILNKIDLTKFDIDFVVIKDPETAQFYDQTVINKGMKIIAVGDLHHGSMYKYISTRRDIWRLIKTGRYDVVHIHSGHIDKFPDAIAAKICGIKTIIFHSHNGKLTKSVKFYRLRCIMQMIVKQFYPCIITDYFSCSDLAAKWAFPKRLIKANKVIQVNNGIDIQRFCYSDVLREEYRRKMRLEDKFVVGHIGRFSYQKNHDFLIDIFNLIAQNNQDAVLVLVGTGELKSKIEEKVKSYGLEDRTIFYGVTRDIPGVLAAIDVFLFPSHFEGLPVVGVEVQAMALHTIASDNISDDIKISPFWESMSLEQGAEQWAEAVLQYSNGYTRYDMSEGITDAGFNIQRTVDLISEIYLK